MSPAPQAQTDGAAEAWSVTSPAKWPVRWWNGRTRTVLFVYGGLAALQSSDALDAVKIAYLIIAAAVVSSATIVALRSHDERHLPEVWPWLWISFAFLMMIAVSLPVALAHGNGFTPWLRGVAPFVLFAAAPLVALDARRAMSTREILGWTVLATALATVSFSVYWLERRQIADLGIDRLVLPSAQLAYAGLAVGTAYALRSNRPIPWAVFAGLILGLLFITGTRTTLLLLVVPATLAIVVGRSHWRRIGGVLVLGSATAGLVVMLTVAALSSDVFGLANRPVGPGGSPAPGSSQPVTGGGPAETPRPDLIGERFGSVGQMVTDPTAGQSLKERIAQSEAAFTVFAADPILGSGPGRLYTWINSSGRSTQAYSLDSPLMIPASFGLLGMLVFIALMGAFVSFIWRTNKWIGRRPEHLAFVGLTVAFGVTSLLGPPMDDKGAAYALTLVLALALTALSTTRHDAQL